MSLSQTYKIATTVEVLFGLNNHTWMDPFQAASYLNLSTKQLAQWRDGKTGPRYTKTPEGGIRYKRQALDFWMEKHTVETDEGGAA